MSNDYYRPNGYQQAPIIDDFPPPPPDMPPMPPRVFHGSAADSWRPGNNHYDPRTYSQQNNFSFNVNGRAPAYPSQQDRDQVRDNYRPAQRSGQPYRGRGRGRGARIITAERPLLQAQRDEASQKMLGIAGEPGAQKFHAMDNATDSDDAPMDQSDSEEDASPRPAPADMNGSDDPLEPPMKRRALAKEVKEASSVPKWSNPDPYTVLPPVDEESRKRKDVVKLIRKARIATEKEEAAQNEVAANDDFISFGFEDDNVSEDEETENHGVPGAPTGPRDNNKSQHPQEFRSQLPPGTSVPPGISASQLGPPPGLTSNPSTGLPPIPIQNHAPRQNGGALRDGQDTNLGSRKRNHDDEIKPTRPRAPPTRKGKGAPSNGSLSNEWIPRRDTDPTPWVVKSQYLTENAGFRLHKEICDFYGFVKPRHFEQRVREDILQRLQLAVRHEIPNSEVHCFGSFAAGLYLPNADMDVVVISQTFRDSGSKTACQSNGKMRKFGNYLETTVAERGSVECIPNAKVPIIKFVDRITAIRVDMSFENNTGIVANDTFSLWKGQFPAMPILVTVIKQFLMMRGLNDVATGGLGGFSVTCLVISLLQNMPRVQTGKVIPDHHLGEMLIEFLDFYGNQLDISRTGISMNPPGYFDKEIAAMRKRAIYQENKSDRLAIVDPNKPENDISGGSRIVSLIFDRFSRAHEEILIAMRSPHRKSLLDWMLGGDYENFTWQRDHLQDLYERRWGPVGAEPLTQQWAGQIHNPYILHTSRSYVQAQGLSGSSSVFYDPSPVATTQIIERPNANRHRKQAPDNREAYIDIPQSKKSTVTKSQPNKSTATKAKGTHRAKRLQEQYPLMKGIPQSVTVKKKQKLIAEYAKNNPNVNIPVNHSSRRSAAEHPTNIPKNSNTNISKRIKVKVGKSKARRKTDNDHKGGMTDPITIE